MGSNKISTKVLNSKGQMEDKDYTELCPLCGETVDMHSGRDFLSLYDNYHNDFIEVNVNAVWCPKCYGVLEGYVGTQGTEYSGKEFETPKEEKTMKFNGIKNIDHLIRKAAWAETVEGFSKIALQVGPEDALRDKLLHYLEKDEQKYRGKLKKYKGELERIKEMKRQLINGASIEEVNRGLEEPDFFDNTDELEQRLEDSKLNELSENEAYEKMLWNK